ncbi:MAG: hypothetical protein WC667_09265 [Sulfurimonas sp.]
MAIVFVYSAALRRAGGVIFLVYLPKESLAEYKDLVENDIIQKIDDYL